MLRFATIFRIMKTSKIFNDKEEFFKVILKNKESEEENFFYRSNINVEFNKISKIINNIDSEFIFNSININNKAVSLKNVLTGKIIYIYPEHPSESDLISNKNIEEYIEDFINESS